MAAQQHIVGGVGPCLTPGTSQLVPTQVVTTQEWEDFQARRALYQLYRLTRAAGGSGVGAAGDSDASAEDGA